MRKTFFILLFLVLASASLTWAQETTTGSITGRVVDAQNLPVPGAAVTIITPQGRKVFTTDGDGRFFAPFLTPGGYQVRVELQGFRPIDRKNIDVGLGRRVDLSLTLEVGNVNEVVEVTAAPPIVDTSTSAVSTTLGGDQLVQLPVGRRFSDTLYVAPGVSSGGLVGRANPSVGGGSGLENQYVVDGVNITNAGYGALGSYSIVFGSLGNGVPFDFIKEEQIKTGGYEAEFGQATGGVVNLVTKSGTNQLHGSLFSYIRPSKTESAYTPITTANGTVNVTATRTEDSGFEVGGPIIKDHLFFFGAFDPQWERTTFMAPPGFPLGSLGPVNRDRRVVSYATKGTWQLAPGHRIDASFFGDPARGDNGPQRYQALLRQDTSGFSRLDKYGGHNQTVRYEGAINPAWLIEASYARAQNDIVEVPSVDQWSVTDTTVTPNVRTGGIGFYEVGNSGVNRQYQAKSTHIAKHHQIRYGVQFDDISYDNTMNRTGPTFTLPNGQQTVTGAQVQILPDVDFGEIFRVTRANTTNVRHTTQHYASVFAQDSWTIGNRFVLMPGLRYERQRLIGTLSDIVLDGNWAPRIGATWDPTGHGTMKVYGNWGLYYYMVPNDLAARALSADAGVTRADYFDMNLTQPVPQGTLAAGTTNHFILAGTSADQVDPNAKSTYVNETVVGVEDEAWPGLNLGVRYIHRTIPRVLEDVSPFPIAAYFIDGGLPGTESVEYVLTNPGPATATAGGLGAAFESPIHHYDAVELTANKRLSRSWSLQSSYRWSRLFGTFEGSFRDDNGQSDPGITSLFDFPTNDASYAQNASEFGFKGDIRYLGSLGAGPLPLDRPHQFKLYGNYDWRALTLGVGFLAGSGKPLTALAAHPVYENSGEIPVGVRGSGFMTVDGFRRRTPAELQTDVHADYKLSVGRHDHLVLVTDVFNLFNRQAALDYDPNTETTFGALNPDLGQARARQPRPIASSAGAPFGCALRVLDETTGWLRTMRTSGTG
jgi:hypothetical protein